MSVAGRLAALLALDLEERAGGRGVLVARRVGGANEDLVLALRDLVGLRRGARAVGEAVEAALEARAGLVGVDLELDLGLLLGRLDGLLRLLLEAGLRRRLVGPCVDQERDHRRGRV